MSLAMRVKVLRRSAQRAGEKAGVLHGLHRLKEVVRFVERQTGVLRQMRHHACMVFRMRIQAAAVGRAADAQSPQSLGRQPQLLAIAFDSAGICAELLAEADGNRVLQMRATALDHVVSHPGLRAKGRGAALQAGQQLVQPPQHAQPNGSRDGVVGALRHVDVVVGVYRPARAAQVVTQQRVGAVGNDLVDVHVVAGAGAGLKGINDEFCVQLPVNHFIRSLHDGLRQFRGQAARAPGSPRPRSA